MLWQRRRRLTYVVESSDSFAVCYVAASNVVGDDVHRDRTCGVPSRRDSRPVFSSKGTAGGQVNGGDESVAPAEGSGQTEVECAERRLYPTTM